MGGVLAVIVPVYVAVAVGYISVRTGFVPRSILPALGDFVVKLAMPMLLFGTLATRHVTEFVDVGYLVSYAVGSLVAMAFAFVAMRSVARRAALPGQVVRLRSAFAAMGAGTSNSGYVGYPVMQGAMPQVAAPAFGMNVIVENLLTIPVGLALAERAAGGHASVRALVRGTAARLSRNPMILAIVAGAAVSLLGVPVPGPVAKVLSMFGTATTAPALFIIGGTLVGQSARGRFASLTPLVVGKLLVHPAAVAAITFGLTSLAPVLGLPTTPPELRAAAIVSAAAPTMSIGPILAARYGEADVMTAAAFACTVASLFSLTGVLLLVHAV